MRILVSGSAGWIGSALVRALEGEGHEVARLIRSPSVGRKDVVPWDPERSLLERNLLEGFGGVVHLAGENVARRRWTPLQKARIRDSRVRGTRFLCQSLAELDRPPRVLACASAVGYYGDRGEEVLREDSPRGEGFLAEVCEQWEAAARPATEKGIRTSFLRFGMVLGPGGGALAKILPLFRLGLGGRLGSGRQYMSWVALEDVVAIVRRVLEDGAIAGPVNAVSPSPITNLEFTRTLGRVLRRPVLFPVPAFALRLALGEMADGMLLASARAEPTRLREAGFAFRRAELEGTLRHLLSP